MPIGCGGRYFFGMKEISPSPAPLRKCRSSWPIAFVLLALIFAAVVVLIFLRLESWPARTTAQGTVQLERLGRDLRAAFIDVAHLQPKITVKDRVYFEQVAPAAELATVTRRTEIEHEFLHTWAGSSKRIRLHGVFVVKAGFDLHKNFAVDVRENEINVRLPPAQILGVEEKTMDVLAFENGLWNRISAADVENELQVLPQLARQKATEAGLAFEAERTLKEQLEKKIQVKQPVHVIFTASIPTG
jgi:hypothetical protein